jgi:N-acetylglutamate synthase-like GNAT family acetyltransferase
MAAVYVIPERRGMGIGSALVRAAMEEAKHISLDRLYLLTPDRSSFYARLGWNVLDKVEYRGENVTIMVYEVDDQISAETRM